MPLFVIIGKDKPNSLQARLDARPAHLARLNALKEQARLIIAGPMPINPEDMSQGITGSLVVADFESQQALDEWLQEEPYLASNVYASVDTYPYILALSK